MTARATRVAGSMPGHRRVECGIVLLIALAAMAAMSLASVALVRAVDTTTAVVGNLAFREAAIAPANAAIEDAVAALFENTAIADREHDLPARGYYASRRAGEDARGVPLVLQDASTSARQTTSLDTGMGNTVSYVIERLCLASGAATPATCNLAVPYVPGAVPVEGATGPAPAFPVFRITARVDGPQNTLVLVQMMLRDSVPPQRMSWRTYAERLLSLFTRLATSLCTGVPSPRKRGEGNACSLPLPPCGSGMGVRESHLTPSTACETPAQRCRRRASAR